MKIKMARRLIFIFIVYAHTIFAQSDKVVVTDWTDVTFTSSYGNPITIIYKLERATKPADHMGNQYKYYLRFKSKTTYLGKQQPVWVGFDISFEDKSSGSMRFGLTLHWDKVKSWSFWNPAKNVKLNLKLNGRIGTFLNEIETMSKYAKGCSAIINDIERHSQQEFYQGMKGKAKSLGEATTDVFSKEIGDFIRKYSKTMEHFWKIQKSTAFGVVVDLAAPNQLGTPLTAFKESHERARGHLYVLEQEFAKLGVSEKPSPKTTDIETQEIQSDFWNTPENNTKTVSGEEYKRIKASIAYSQGKLKKELENMRVAYEGIKIEKKLGTKQESECRYLALDEYFNSYMYNAEVMLSIEVK